MTKPTIAELEHILAGGDGPQRITMLPNGEIRAVDDWRPIETGPRDGTSVLCALHFPDGKYWGQHVLCWDVSNSLWCDGLSSMWYEKPSPEEYPTHWMSLPEPPK